MRESCQQDGESLTCKFKCESEDEGSLLLSPNVKFVSQKNSKFKNEILIKMSTALGPPYDGQPSPRSIMT